MDWLGLVDEGSRQDLYRLVHRLAKFREMLDEFKCPMAISRLINDEHAPVVAMLLMQSSKTEHLAFQKVVDGMLLAAPEQRQKWELVQGAIHKQGHSPVIWPTLPHAPDVNSEGGMERQENAPCPPTVNPASVPRQDDWEAPQQPAKARTGRSQTQNHRTSVSDGMPSPLSEDDLGVTAEVGYVA